MIEQGKMTLSRNSILVWIGLKFMQFSKFLNEKGGKIVENNKPIVVVNPEVVWINAMTLLFTFTTQGSIKQQMVLQSRDYIEKYKLNNEKVELTEEEQFLCISANRKLWFQKS